MRTLVIFLALTISANAMAAEARVRDALTYMLSRYRDTKLVAPPDDTEVALACAGETFKEWVQTYLAVAEQQHIDKSLVANYSDAKDLIEHHQYDVENIYPKLREGLVTAIHQVVANMRHDGKLPKLPTLTIDDYGADALQANLTNCDNVEFVAEVARITPISGSYEDEVTVPAYKIPIGENDGNFAPPGSEDTPDQTQSLKKWLYEISRR